MNNRSSYGDPPELRVSVEPFTKEQRQRLEALTLVRAFDKTMTSPGRLSDWLTLSEYIISGSTA